MKKVLLAMCCALLLSVPARAADSTISMFAAGTNLKEIMDAFTADTGIGVEILEMSTGEVLTRVRASRGKAQADAWYGGGLDSYISAAAEDFLEPYISPDRKGIPERFMDEKGYWTGISLGAVEILVNTEILARKQLPMPTSWEDLAKAVYKGEVLMATPSVSGTFYFMVAEILAQFGEEKGWALLEAIDRNVPYYSKRGAEPANKVSTGEAAIAVAPFDTGYKLIADGHPLQAVLPTDGTPWYISPVAVFKGARNPEGAQAFVNWIISDKGQAQIAKYAPPAPVRPGMQLTEGIQALEKANLINCDIVKIGEQREAILEQWQAKFGDK